MTTTRHARLRRPALPGLWILAALIPVTVSCGDRDLTGREPALRPGQFVEIIVALREAEWEVAEASHPDSAIADFQHRRAEILEHHGATEESLRRFVERYHRRPGVMSTVWDSIAQRLRSPAPDGYDDEPWPQAEEW
jgi:hypothetical protein